MVADLKKAASSGGASSSATCSAGASLVSFSLECEEYDFEKIVRPAISPLSDEEAKKGVCTHSSGNHAQAVG